MTSKQVEEALSRRKARPDLTWSSSKVERVRGETLQRGGHALLGSRATYAEILAALGHPDRERTTRLSLPGSQEECLQLIYSRERLSVERTSEGVVSYELL